MSPATEFTDGIPSAYFGAAAHPMLAKPYGIDQPTKGWTWFMISWRRFGQGGGSRSWMLDRHLHRLGPDGQPRIEYCGNPVAFRIALPRRTPVAD